MKTILIHSDNTSLIEIDRLHKNELFFSIPKDKTVDEYMTTFINENIIPEGPDAIFVKYALTDNYLNFLGLRLAYHIRLHANKEIALVPIIFVGEETPIELMKLSSLSRILATTGIYYVKENLDEVKKILSRIDKNELLGLVDYNWFLENISVPTPSNYDTRHSLANELALYFWSDYIGCSDQIDELQSKINSNLYFKYKTRVNDFKSSGKNLEELPKFNHKAKVILVDDESNKGWGAFYNHFFSNSPDIDFNPFNVAPTNSSDTIVAKCSQLLKNDKPDLVLLDLRLSDLDAEEQEPTKLTGYKVLQEIKNENKGTQVIITTASNKAPIFRELNNAGADGYIIKGNTPEQGVNSLIDDIRLCLKDAVLKFFYINLEVPYQKVQDEKLDKIISYRAEDDDNFEALCYDIIYYFDIAGEIILNPKVEERFSYGVLQLYKVLETITDYYIRKDHSRQNYEFIEGDESIMKFNFSNGYQPSRATSHLSELQLIYNIYYRKNGVNEQLFQDLYDLFMYRNNYAHHTDPNSFDQLEDIYYSNFSLFKSDFYKYYNSVFQFINEISN